MLLNVTKDEAAKLRTILGQTGFETLAGAGLEKLFERLTKDAMKGRFPLVWSHFNDDSAPRIRTNL